LELGEDHISLENKKVWGFYAKKKKKKIRVCRKQEKWQLKTRDDCLRCEAPSKKKKLVRILERVRRAVACREWRIFFFFWRERAKHCLKK
jgi:hypothetical protein